MTAELSEPPPACTFILPDKRRRCRLPRKHGVLFCGAHSNLPTAASCSHCGTQLPSASALARHTRTVSPLCPVLRREAAAAAQPWYIRDCNQHAASSALRSQARSGMDAAQLEKIVDGILEKLPLEDLTLCASGERLAEAEVIAARWADARNSSTKLEPKHFAQIEALCALLLTPSPTKSIAILEIGAGRSYTALYATEVLQLRGQGAAVVAVDRASARHKADRVFHAWETAGRGTFRRLRCDVKDLWVAGVEEVRECEDLRVVGKHTCGIALDMGMKAVVEFAKTWEGEVRMVLASCCRRLCKWGIGQEVWSEWGVDAGTFTEICRGASWGLGERQEDWRKVVGGKCRKVVDLARVVWLRRQGWKAWRGKYTSASPEDACIVATREPNIPG